MAPTRQATLYAEHNYAAGEALSCAEHIVVASQKGTLEVHARLSPWCPGIPFGSDEQFPGDDP